MIIPSQLIITIDPTHMFIIQHNWLKTRLICVPSFFFTVTDKVLFGYAFVDVQKNGLVFYNRVTTRFPHCTVICCPHSSRPFLICFFNSARKPFQSVLVVPFLYMPCHYKSSRSKFIVVKKLSTYTMMSFVSYIFS